MTNLKKELIAAKNDMELEVKAALQKFHDSTGIRIETVNVIAGRSVDGGVSYNVSVGVKI